MLTHSSTTVQYHIKKNRYVFIDTTMNESDKNIINNIFKKCISFFIQMMRKISDEFFNANEYKN